MSEPDPAAPPPTWIRRNLWNLIAAAVLLVIAMTPAEVAWALAIGDALLLWALFSAPLFKGMTRGSEGLGKAFLGLMAIVVGAFGALLLVGLACLGPASRVNLH